LISDKILFSLPNLPYFGDFVKEWIALTARFFAPFRTMARLTNLELAEKISLSPTATAERLKRLGRDGYIHRLHRPLSAEKLDRGMLVFVEVKLDRTTPDVFDAFSDAVRKSDDVMECHMVAGGFDYLVKARVSGMEAYRTFFQMSFCPCPAFAKPTHIRSWKK
jgi:Lrp/AsnC family leucine-responsive transcriptional regulator